MAQRVAAHAPVAHRGGERFAQHVAERDGHLERDLEILFVDLLEPAAAAMPACRLVILVLDDEARHELAEGQLRIVELAAGVVQEASELGLGRWRAATD
jgi:hypothetical protein